MPARKRSSSVVRVRKDRPEDLPAEVRIAKFRGVRQAEKSPFQRTPTEIITSDRRFSHETPKVPTKIEAKPTKRLSDALYNELREEVKPQKVRKYRRKAHTTKDNSKKEEPLQAEEVTENPISPIKLIDPCPTSDKPVIETEKAPRRTSSEIRAAMNDILYLNSEISRISQKENTLFTTIRPFICDNIVTARDSAGFDHLHCIPINFISQASFGDSYKFRDDMDMVHLLAFHIAGIDPEIISARLKQDASLRTDVMFAAECYITKWVTFYPDDFAIAQVHDDVIQLIKSRSNMPRLDYDLFARALENVVTYAHEGGRFFTSIKPAALEDGEEILGEIESLDTETLCYTFMYLDLQILSDVTISDWCELIMTGAIKPNIQRVIDRQRDEIKYFKCLLRHHRFCKDLMSRARHRNNLFLWNSLNETFNRGEDLVPHEGSIIDKYRTFLLDNHAASLPCIEPFIGWLKLAGDVVRSRGKDDPLDGLQLDTMWNTLQTVTSQWCKSIRFAEKGVTKKLCEFVELDISEKLNLLS